MPEYRVHPPDKLPDVEVLVNGAWCEGELRAWTPTETGWVAQVQWRRTAGTGDYLDTFPAAAVRLSSV